MVHAWSSQVTIILIYHQFATTAAKVSEDVKTITDYTNVDNTS